MNNPGLTYAITAFSLWGLFPIFWKQLAEVDSVEILAHRVIWGGVFMVALTLIGRQWRGILAILRDTKSLLICLTTSLLVGFNWWLNIYAVNSGHIIESSMGSYIIPPLNVLLGVVFFKETLRPIQWLSIALAAAGVGYIILEHGYVPWIALMLASCFAVYGAIKKMTAFHSTNGMAVETWLLLIPALVYLALIEGNGSGQFGDSAYTTTFLMLSGPASLLPLLLFAAAAQRISLTLIGVCQYIGPSMSLVIGVLMYDEVFDQTKIIAFSFIWLGLALFTLENLRAARRRASAVGATDRRLG